MDNYEKSKKILEKYGQEHILTYYEKMSEENKKKLLEQILTIDFDQINKLYEEIKSDQIKAEKVIEPIPYLDKATLSEEELKKYEELGQTAIKNGKLAVVTMAGGQRNKAWTPRS